MLNIDESGVRVGCPTGENIIVPSDVKEHYTISPENRKSLTIIETVYGDGREPLLPFIITPGAKLMENWILNNLIGNEKIDCSLTSYTNNCLVMEYAKHLINYVHAGPNKPWKVLLLDGYKSHHFDPFKMLLLNNYIKPFYFPSYLIHAL